MISLEQIKLLEKKVSDAVHLISVLKEENKMLKRTIESSQTRMQELEELVTAFKHDQAAIETTVLNAIQKLDILEDEISDLETKNNPDLTAVPESVVVPEAVNSKPQIEVEPAESEALVIDKLPEIVNEQPVQEKLVSSNEFELEQEEETVITVDDLQAPNPDRAGLPELSEILDRPLPDQPADFLTEVTETEEANTATDEQSNFLFFNQNLNDKHHESIVISDKEEHKIESASLHLHGAQPLFQNKIYVQRQTEYRELDIF